MCTLNLEFSLLRRNTSKVKLVGSLTDLYLSSVVQRAVICLVPKLAEPIPFVGLKESEPTIKFDELCS